MLSIIGAIVAEFVGAQRGIGYLIMQYNFNLNTAGIFALLVVLSLIGVGCTSWSSPCSTGSSFGRGRDGNGEPEEFHHARQIVPNARPDRRPGRRTDRPDGGAGPCAGART